MITNILLAALGFFILMTAVFSLLMAVGMIKSNRETRRIKGSSSWTGPNRR
jgi:hypothetical protein